MLLVLLLPLGLLAPPAQSVAGIEPPREATWAEVLAAGYDPDRCIPWFTSDQYPNRGKGADLLQQAERLLATDFYALTVGSEDADSVVPYASFGDVLAALQNRRHDPKAVDALLDELRRVQPVLLEQAQGWLEELTRDWYLYTDKWHPKRERRDDGIYMGDPLPLPAKSAMLAPWRKLKGDRTLYQIATFVRADVSCMKAVEHDFPGYKDYVASDVIDMYPLPGQHWRGVDLSGRPFAYVRASLHADLPFPYSTYKAVINVMSRVREDGVAYTELFADSDDFHWMVGRDVYFPVHTSAGEWIGTLVVRHFGMDVDGVPEGRGNREDSGRNTLGNKKRNAEARCPSEGEHQPDGERWEPAFEVLGAK